MFENKKNFCIEYSLKDEHFLLLLKATSEENALKKFNKKYADEIMGIYPYPEHKIISIRRIYKKVQF